MADETHSRAKRVAAAKSERTALPALDDNPAAKVAGVGRALVCITQCRTKFLDPDNLVGSVKALLDGLSEAGLIAGDSESQITLEVAQTKVAHRTDHKTIIEIFYAQTPD